jgi:BirA family transcriptional regulator, biotin operon repressor / biotin---[acetyl-CoA-carboxylase] ligase
MHPSLAPPAIDATLLGLLLEADEPAPLSQLANQLQITPDTLQKHISTLQSYGCVFEQRPDGNLKLTDAGLGVWCDYLQACAPTDSGAPRLIEVYPRTSSTQDAVARLIKAYALKADGALAVADYQESGRGRLGRAWVAPSGTCLTFSTAVIIDPSKTPFTSDRLMLATSVAVAHALEELPGIPPAGVRIKWPNDILIANKKLAGILVEQSTPPNSPLTAYVIGIGINVDIDSHHLDSSGGLPPELLGKITSLRLTGIHTHRLSLLARTLTLLHRYIHTAEPDWLRDQWRDRSGQLGRHITLAFNNNQTSGTVLDIDPQHGLILQTDQGPILHLPAATTSVVN